MDAIAIANQRRISSLEEQILLGVIVLEDLDLMVDCNRHRLIPYQGTWDQPVFRV
jgi:hypothetical protein